MPKDDFRDEELLADVICRLIGNPPRGGWLYPQFAKSVFGFANHDSEGDSY
jgi:hypothetical protein